jgi:plastocyanin
MRLRRFIIGALVAVPVTATVGTAISSAAVRTVDVGNFYFDDSTPGDGVVSVQAGDQITFRVLDSGPGTPHHVDIDAFNIHSGGLSAGETFTTPALNTPGTYVLYCNLHLNRGHKTTLVVGGSATPTPTATPVPTPTAAPVATATAVPSVGPTPSASDPTPTEPPLPVEVPDATATPSDEDDAAAAVAVDDDQGGTPSTYLDEGLTGDEPVAVAVEEVAAEGVGGFDLREVAAPPPVPGSLADILGQDRSGEPWTHAVRLSLVAIPLLAAVAGAAVAVDHRRGSRPRQN